MVSMQGRYQMAGRALDEVTALLVLCATCGEDGGRGERSEGAGGG